MKGICLSAGFSVWLNVAISICPPDVFLPSSSNCGHDRAVQSQKRLMVHLLKLDRWTRTRPLRYLIILLNEHGVFFYLPRQFLLLGWLPWVISVVWEQGRGVWRHDLSWLTGDRQELKVLLQSLERNFWRWSPKRKVRDIHKLIHFILFQDS